jgi:hypothetical protein
MKIFHLGFTGTRHGMTEAQLAAYRTLITEIGPHTLHHGDCIGSDAMANAASRATGNRTESHPPLVTAMRAYVPVDQAHDPHHL